MKNVNHKKLRFHLIPVH